MQSLINLPWFLWVRETGPLITSRTIPDRITDSKGIVLTEQPVPGLNYQPIIPGGNANRKIGFTIPIVSRTPLVGNSPALALFEQLRNQVQSGVPGLDKRFNPNPKVLYMWGTGQIALPCVVSRVDFDTRADMVNGFGAPQHTEVSVELIVDESDPLYQMEAQFRALMTTVGQMQTVIPTAVSTAFNSRPW
jgi:hypothetical protein